MDSDLRQAERAVRANPRDDDARAALALAERRAGRGIGADVEPDALARVIEAPWVDAYAWAAVHVGFREVCIVRPGHLHQVKGHQPWMRVHTHANARIGLPEQPIVVRTACSTGRCVVGERWSQAALNRFNDGLLRWVQGDCGTEVPLPPIDLGTVGSGTVRGRARELRTMHVARTKETWSIEHVRLHCGLDPRRVSCTGAPEVNHRDPLVHTCMRCRRVEGRERASGHVLCHDCWKTFGGKP